MSGMLYLVLGLLCAAAVKDQPVNAPRLEIAGDWQVRVLPGTVHIGRKSVRIMQPATVDIKQATVIRGTNEKFDSLPLFDANAAPWAKGARLRQLDTFETTAADMLIPESLVLKSGSGDAPKYVRGTDYEVETRWATIGRLANGIPENTPVWVDYACGWGRLDSIVVDSRGAVSVRSGKPHNATPHAPDLAADEVRLANIWVPGRLERLSADNLYPIVEAAFAAPKRTGPPPAAKLLPKTWAKLHNHQPLTILAWGDSVTAGGQASDAAHQYQSRFVALLQERFPKASLHLTTAGWGGRNTDSFLKEPPGAQYNFDHAVIEPHPDLIVMEFVNDAWMSPEVIEEKYSYLLKRFQEIGAEWIIVTPHYVRPDWMGAPSVRVENDPRPYVAGVRQFAEKHHVALADASLRWGHLLKEGIPYTTLLSNSINHPDDRGHEMFALALLDLFR